MGVLLPAPPCPRPAAPLSRACHLSFSGSSPSCRLPYCDLHAGGEGAAGKNASGPFLAGGALPSTPTFPGRDNAAKSEGSNNVAPPSPAPPVPCDCSAVLTSRPLGGFVECGCVVCLSVLHTETITSLPNLSVCVWGGGVAGRDTGCRDARLPVVPGTERPSLH